MRYMWPLMLTISSKIKGENTGKRLRKNMGSDCKSITTKNIHVNEFFLSLLTFIA